MAVRVPINGFGRIGRLVVRALHETGADRAVPPHPASASHPTAPTEFDRFSQLGPKDFTGLAA
jgi:prephenate dehydrogenase